jgi:hypothetical protein
MLANVNGFSLPSTFHQKITIFKVAVRARWSVLEFVCPISASYVVDRAVFCALGSWTCAEALLAHGGLTGTYLVTMDSLG